MTHVCKWSNGLEKKNPTVSHPSLTSLFTVSRAKLIYQTYHCSTQDYRYLHHLHKASSPLHHYYQKPQPSHHQFEPPLRSVSFSPSFRKTNTAKSLLWPLICKSQEFNLHYRRHMPPHAVAVDPCAIIDSSSTGGVGSRNQHHGSLL